MDDTAFLRERIDAYAGYTNESARQQSDRQVRAYVGEAVSRVRQRLHPAGAGDADLERLLLRCEFVDLDRARAFDAAQIDPREIAATTAADRELVAAADAGANLAAADLRSWIERVNAAFDRRYVAPS